MVEQIAQEHQTVNSLGSLAVGTACRRHILAAGRDCLHLVLMDDVEGIELKDAYRLADLPMQAPNSVRAIFSRWPHLRDTGLVDQEIGRVDLLL